MAMIVLLFLGVLAGRGVFELVVRRRRVWLWPAVCVAFLAESAAAPLTLNDVWRDPSLRPPPSRLLLGSETPPVYSAVEQLPAQAVLVEFPFGSPTYELRYMLYSLSHGRALLNGYSGAMPPSYVRNQAISDPLREPDRAWAAVTQSGATHAVVHEGAWWRRGLGHRVSAWLTNHGAREVARFGSDVLLALPSPTAAPADRMPPHQ
jgi:hypothetical protein